MLVFCDDLQARPLLNCAGGGTCATCMVEVGFFFPIFFFRLWFLKTVSWVRVWLQKVTELYRPVNSKN